jgi:hypothetical protein
VIRLPVLPSHKSKFKQQTQESRFALDISAPRSAKPCAHETRKIAVSSRSLGKLPQGNFSAVRDDIDEPRVSVTVLGTQEVRAIHALIVEYSRKQLNERAEGLTHFRGRHHLFRMSDHGPALARGLGQRIGCGDAADDVEQRSIGRNLQIEIDGAMNQDAGAP